jgi:sirohydrochlorin cobaltochelatase
MIHKTVIVLAMHGSPPNDYPQEKKKEFFALHGRIEAAPLGSVPPEVSDRYKTLEDEMRAWPRNEENDPYHDASVRMGNAIARSTGLPVVVTFNEFCGPGIEEGLETAVVDGFDRIVVTTPMMTRGGAHAGTEIPGILEEFRKRNPDIRVTYAWPFEVDDIARFIGEQIQKHL